MQNDEKKKVACFIDYVKIVETQTGDQQLNSKKRYDFTPIINAILDKIISKKNTKNNINNIIIIIIIIKYILQNNNLNIEFKLLL
jgi:hypothetical protein